MKPETLETLLEKLGYKRKKKLEALTSAERWQVKALELEGEIKALEHSYYSLLEQEGRTSL
jgi:hypothetical protein